MSTQGGSGGVGGAIATVAGEGGLPKIVAHHAESGAVVEVYLHGATVTSYRTGRGQEILFVSSRAVFDGAKAIRGGIPIVFPQFGTQGPLVQHGFARTNAWTPVAVGDGVVELVFSDTESTREVWPHPFRLHYRILFDDNHLSTALEVINPKGSDAAFSFDALLHTYLSVGPGGLSSARVTGLKGVTYISRAEGGAARVEGNDHIAFDGEVDRVYVNTDAEVALTGIGGGGDVRSITVKRAASVRDAPPAVRGGAVHAPLDLVVWNAGAARCAAIADFGPEDYQHYVCIEPGRVSAATADVPANKSLAPGKQWTLRQDLLLHRAEHTAAGAGTA